MYNPIIIRFIHFVTVTNSKKKDLLGFLCLRTMALVYIYYLLYAIR